MGRSFGSIRMAIKDVSARKMKAEEPGYLEVIYNQWLS